jgi:periplasmic protein TonB
VTTLLESKARPYGSSKGAALSVVVHGGLIAAAVVASGAVALPEREKVEEHPILYVTPPPPKVYVAPERLPEPKRAPPSKAPRTAPPPPQAPPPPRQVAAPSPQRVTVPVIAPIKVPVSIPPVDLKAIPTVSDAELARASDAVKAASRGAKGSADGDVEGRSGKGGLGSGDAGRAYNENQVDRAVQMTRAATPRYPDALKSVNVEGQVQVRYIVDARGRVEPGSIQVLSTTHKLFAEAVREALLNSRFRPAEAGGHAVRQLVEQPFIFKLDH